MITRPPLMYPQDYGLEGPVQPILDKPFLQRELLLQLTQKMGGMRCGEIQRMLAQNFQPTLFEIQRDIGKYNLSEPDAKVLLKISGFPVEDLPETAAYLMFCYSLHVEPNFLPERNLKRLLITAIHSAALKIPLVKARDELPSFRPSSLTDKQFERLKSFMAQKVLPLIKYRNYQSIADSLVVDVIQPYPALDKRNKEILVWLISDAAEIGMLLYQQGYQRYNLDTNNMRVEGEHKPGDYQELNDKLNRFLSDLNSERQASHPTGYEILLRTFEAQGFQPVDIADLCGILYGEREGTELTLHSKISKLNLKLQPYGLRIERSSTYSLKEIENK